MKPCIGLMALTCALVTSACSENPSRQADTGNGSVDGPAVVDARGGCGDGVREGVEQCDGQDLAGRICSSEGFDGGTLACKADCTLDTSACHRCGDGEVSGVEQCDGTDLGGETCVTQGFDSGVLSCTSTCQLDLSKCTIASCGNGQRDPAEPCEGTDLGGKTCKTEGFDGGDLSCASNCSLDLSGCFKCGDGAINGAEECDGSQLGGKTCVTEGFDDGQLGCGPDCTFSTTACTKCGDGVVNGAEQCDGSQLGGKTCKSLGFAGGTLSCKADCTFSTSACTSSPPPDAKPASDAPAPDSTPGDTGTTGSPPTIYEEFNPWSGNTSPDGVWRIAGVWTGTGGNVLDPALAKLTSTYAGESSSGFLSLTVKANEMRGSEIQTLAGYGYGYYEVRMKVSPTPGICDSFFWIEAPSYGSREWDVEFLTNEPWISSSSSGKVHYTIHPSGKSYIANLPFNPSKGFHRYGFLWTPGKIDYTIDGQLSYSFTDASLNSSAKGFIMMNAWTGNPNWGGGPPTQDATTVYDWVKFYAGATSIPK
jgi:hypothetical protein